MELLIGSLFVAGGVLGSLIVNVLGADAYDRCPRLARWILKRAVSRLPEDKRQRYEEEWMAHLFESETNLDQVRHALGAWWSVTGMKASEPRLKTKIRRSNMILSSSLVVISVIGESIHGLSTYMTLSYFMWAELPIILTGSLAIFSLVKARRKFGDVIEV